MVFILVQPGKPMLAKNYEGDGHAEFSTAVQKLLGGPVVLCRPFKNAPDICLVVRDRAAGESLPANRSLKKPDGSTHKVIWGSFVLFAMSKEMEFRDLNSAEKAILAKQFMDCTQPDIIPMLNDIPTPHADTIAARITMTLLAQVNKTPVFRGFFSTSGAMSASAAS